MAGEPGLSLRPPAPHPDGGDAGKEGCRIPGWAAYELGELESVWNRVTVALARNAEYANVGENRTGGFGVVNFLAGENLP